MKGISPNDAYKRLGEDMKATDKKLLLPEKLFKHALQMLTDSFVLQDMSIRMLNNVVSGGMKPGPKGELSKKFVNDINVITIETVSMLNSYLRSLEK